jgi:Fe-S-cluster containining protein
MDQAGFPDALVFDLKKESPFSFKCQVCSACCVNKAIRVAPYEALRLARNLSLTTTEFYQTCTEEEGIILRNKPDGSCLFLGSRGCGVYPDRPLVCRLFPLGQITDREGREKYAAMPLHPDCLGIFDTDGTVESYLDAQGAEVFFHYDEVYAAIYKDMLKQLESDGFIADEAGSSGDAKPADPKFSPQRALLSTWLDIDKTVAAFCQKKGRMEPKSLEDAVSIHLEAIKGWLVALKKRRRRERHKRGNCPL